MKRSIFCFLLLLSSLSMAQEFKGLEECLNTNCDELFGENSFLDEKGRLAFPITLEKVEEKEQFGAGQKYSTRGAKKKSFIQDGGDFLKVGATAILLEDSFEEEDKQLHFRAGAMIGFFSAKVCEKGLIPYKTDFFASKRGRFFCALTGAAAAGVLKEVYDSTDRENHTVDHRDAIATGLGGFTQFTLYKIEF